MRLSALFASNYDPFARFGAVFFVVLFRWCSQILTTGYHSAFNYSVDVDR